MNVKEDPADVATTFTEVRDCRHSHEHELRHISTQVRSATEVRFVYVVTAPAEVVDPLLTVERVRTATSTGLHEELRVASALRDPVELDLGLVLGLDATSMEQVKHGAVGPRVPVPEGPRWSWRDADTTAAVDVADGTVEVCGSEVVLGWHVAVAPGSELIVRRGDLLDGDLLDGVVLVDVDGHAVEAHDRVAPGVRVLAREVRRRPGHLRRGPRRGAQQPGWWKSGSPSA